MYMYAGYAILLHHLGSHNSHGTIYSDRWFVCNVCEIFYDIKIIFRIVHK